MTTDKTPATLATAKHGGCVQLGDAARVTMSEDDFANLVEGEASEHGEMLEDGGPYNGWCFSCEELIEFSRGIINAWGMERYGRRDDLCGQLQQKCSDWGTYWRAPDAHGVILNEEQARELLRDALGVEVDFTSAQPSPGGQGELATLVTSWRSRADKHELNALEADSIGDMTATVQELETKCDVLRQVAGELEAALAARQPVGEPVDDDWHLRGYAYASKQATTCAGCGKHKHTPLRIDAMGGHVCLTCIDQKLGALLGEFGYSPAQAVDLGQLPHGIRLIEIPGRNNLDPINVFVQDYELGRGRIVVTCYGQAWCGFWGAMGDRTVMQFVAACDADYVAGNMLSGRHEHVRKHERAYVERIATEVIAEFRSLIGSQAVQS